VPHPHPHRRPAEGNVLVVYGLFAHPLRSTVEDHLLAFRRYSGRRVFHLNARVQEVPRHILRRRFDLIVFQTTFLSNRWAPELFEEMLRRVAPLKTLSGVRVAMPQDEFLRSKLLCDFIDEFDIDVVFSVAPESEWPKIYPTVDRERVRFERVLTGYLDDHTLERIEQIVATTPAQDVDVGYRAWRGAPWLGRHGTLKGTIADAVDARGPRHGLRLDVSTRDEDTLLGDDWFRFLARCRYTVGIEGGASVLDFDGAIKERTDRYVAEHPGADYDEIEEACFPGEDGKLALFAISPRHLEACATRTCQVLVEGDYNRVLEPGRHYLELRSDLSNLDEVLDSLGDETRRERIVEAAHRDVAASGRYTYRAMVQQVERAALAAATVFPAARLTDRAALLVNRAAEHLAWARIAYVLRWQWRPPVALGRAVVSRLSALVPRRRKMDGPKTIVSITPIAVERDSRTFKAAASMARLGYRSIVVEAEPSAGLRNGLPFELITVGGRPPAGGPAPPAQAGAEPAPVGRLGRMAALVPDPVRRAGRPLLGVLSVAHPLATFASQCRAMAAALPPADLYYLHSQYYFPALWWRSRKGRRPFVYDAHDLYWTLRSDGRSLPLADRTMWGVWDRLEQLSARRADACVTVGDGVARHAQDRFARRFSVVRNSHDLRLDASGVPGIRTRLGLGADAFLLAVSGNFKLGMAVEPLVRALAELPGRVHLVFVGAHSQRFAATAAELGVADRTYFVPPVAPTEIVPLLGEADLAPVPYYPSSVSVRHALPNGFFHAVSAGVPVLYPSGLVDLRELAERYELGWEFDPESHASIVAAVRPLLDSPAALDERRARVRAARDELSWAADERELGRVVAGVLAAREGR
jgi:glycosyltransferase involved in cell wall biosynthesis